MRDADAVSHRSIRGVGEHVVFEKMLLLKRAFGQCYVLW